MAFQFKQLAIPDVVLITTQQRKDPRGFFMETYKASAFSELAIPTEFVQDNCVYSTYGVLRGLHYQQEPHAQGKLIMTLKGEIFDVAVDIRQGSDTYGKWVGEVLSGQNCAMLYVPPGFAHGYCVLSENALITYKVSNEYAPQAERGILWNDPDIGIEWPLQKPLVSERDAALPRLKNADNNFVMGGY
jgi:dTDP-4-dehydrorhamnose 3,5-epimerase